MKTYIIVAMIAMAFAVALVSAQGRLSIQLGAGPAYSGYGPGYGPGYGGGYGGYNRPYGADYYGGGYGKPYPKYGYNDYGRGYNRGYYGYRQF